jgi:hypothetical protein
MSTQLHLSKGSDTRIPLVFIGCGLGFLSVAALRLLLTPSLVTQPYFAPAAVGWAHLWLPGFLLTVSIGAVYQLMPVLMGNALEFGRLTPWVHCILHTAGVGVLAWSLSVGKYLWAAVAGTGVVVGSALFFAIVVVTFRHARRRDPAAWSLPLAAAWLLATTAFGLTLALNRQFSFLPLSAMDLLKTHAHLGLVGFFLTLLQGVSFQLVPMFTMSEVRKIHWVWTGLIMTQFGLLILVPGLAFHFAWISRLGALVISLGVVFSAMELCTVFLIRRRRALEPGLAVFAFGGTVILGATVMGLAKSFSDSGVNTPAGTYFYGVLIIIGGLTPIVLGMLCKIIPFLVWMKAYGPLVGKRKVPPATTLGNKRLETAWAVLHLVAATALLGAIALALPWLASVGAVLLCASLMVFGINAVRITSHLYVHHE